MLSYGELAGDADTKRGWLGLLGPERFYELYSANEGSA